VGSGGLGARTGERAGGEIVRDMPDDDSWSQRLVLGGDALLLFFRWSLPLVLRICTISRLFIFIVREFGSQHGGHRRTRPVPFGENFVGREIPGLSTS
jgi:hypothetical protein